MYIYLTKITSFRCFRAKEETEFLQDASPGERVHVTLRLFFILKIILKMILMPKWGKRITSIRNILLSYFFYLNCRDLPVSVSLFTWSKAERLFVCNVIDEEDCSSTSWSLLGLLFFAEECGVTWNPVDPFNLLRRNKKRFLLKLSHFCWLTYMFRLLNNQTIFTFQVKECSHFNFQSKHFTYWRTSMWKLLTFVYVFMQTWLFESERHNYWKWRN